MTNRTKSEFTSHCRIAAKTNFLMLLLFSARFAHARYSSRMIDRFLNWGDHGKPKSSKIKGRCRVPLVRVYIHRHLEYLHPRCFQVIIYRGFRFPLRHTSARVYIHLHLRYLHPRCVQVIIYRGFRYPL